MANINFAGSFDVNSIFAGRAWAGKNVTQTQRELITQTCSQVLTISHAAKPGMTNVDLSIPTNARQTGEAYARLESGHFSALKLNGDPGYMLWDMRNHTAYYVSAIRVGSKGHTIHTEEGTRVRTTQQVEYHIPTVRVAFPSATGRIALRTSNGEVHNYAIGRREIRMMENIRRYTDAQHAITWHHILVALLCGDDINFIDGAARRHVDIGYQNSLLKLKANMDTWNLPRSLRDVRYDAEHGYYFQSGSGNYRANINIPMIDWLDALHEAWGDLLPGDIAAQMSQDYLDIADPDNSDIERIIDRIESINLPLYSEDEPDYDELAAVADFRRSPDLV